jgi:hypothetical protein
MCLRVAIAQTSFWGTGQSNRNFRGISGSDSMKNLKGIIVQPTYSFQVHRLRASHPYPFVSVEAPYEFLSDLSNIPHSYFETLILELEEVLQGKITETGFFGGDRASCKAYKDKTLCDDEHTDSFIYVDTQWMLDLIRKWYEFKMPYFGGYVEE